jgi:hypothetical protein
MGEAINYPQNSSPSDNDELLGISDPGGTWSIQRYPIGQILATIQAQLDAMELALTENDIYPYDIVFTTNGDTFSPTIVLNGEATIAWTFSDGTTSESATPTAEFGSSATRLHRLRVTPWSSLYRINLGYAREDGGHSTDALGNTFEIVETQAVTGIANLSMVKETLAYLCGCGCPITALNVRDFTALHTLEFYGCGDSLAAADIYGTSNLRRACFESSYVGFLDFSASPLMEDVRGSRCHLSEIRWGETGQNLWHMCVRENSEYLDPNTWPSMENFPLLQDLWISGNGLTGDLVASSTVVNSAWLYNNDFDTIDMTNTTANSITAQNNSNCTSITIDGCPDLISLNASGCALTQTNVDYLLATLDGYGTQNGTLNIYGGTNAAPSTAGLASQSSLEGKGWTITTNEVGVPALSTATIGTDGETWTLVFSEAVNLGSGGSGGLIATMTEGGSVALTYVSGSGSATLTYTGNSILNSGDTGTLSYTQPTDGLESVSSTTDVASFTGFAVVNNSGNSETTTSGIAVESFAQSAVGGLTAAVSWSAGDTIVCFAGCWQDSPNNLSVADTDGDNYSVIEASKIDTDVSMAWFYQRKTSAGSGTVTLTSIGNYTTIRVYVISGLAVSPVDFVVSSLTSNTSPAFTTSTENTIVLMGYHHDGAAPTERILTPDSYIWDSNVLARPQRPCCHQIFTSIQTDATITVTPDSGTADDGLIVVGLLAAS